MLGDMYIRLFTQDAGSRPVAGAGAGGEAGLADWNWKHSLPGVNSVAAPIKGI